LGTKKPKSPKQDSQNRPWSLIITYVMNQELFYEREYYICGPEPYHPRVYKVNGNKN